MQRKRRRKRILFHRRMKCKHRLMEKCSSSVLPGTIVNYVAENWISSLFRLKINFASKCSRFTNLLPKIICFTETYRQQNLSDKLMKCNFANRCPLSNFNLPLNNGCSYSSLDLQSVAKLTRQAIIEYVCIEISHKTLSEILFPHDGNPRLQLVTFKSVSSSSCNLFCKESKQTDSFPSDSSRSYILILLN